jgi:hypothetical protein
VGRRRDPSLRSAFQNERKPPLPRLTFRNLAYLRLEVSEDISQHAFSIPAEGGGGIPGNWRAVNLDEKLWVTGGGAL